MSTAHTSELNADTARELAAKLSAYIKHETTSVVNGDPSISPVEHKTLWIAIDLQQRLIDYALAEIGKLRADGEAVGDE